MYNFAVSTFSGVFAALAHAVDFDSAQLDISSKMQFRKSLEDVRLIVERIPMRDMSSFARLVDLTLQPSNDMMYAFNTIIKDGSMTPNAMDLYPDMLDGSTSGYVTPERHSPFHNPMISGQFAFDVCYQQQPSATSSPTGSVSAAAVAAAAAAVGAVDSLPPNKSIEPADYTFELISVADEWARSLIIP
jgi:hypothetical protein